MPESSFVDPHAEVPAKVYVLADGAPVEAVWKSGEGTAFRIRGNPERFAKWRRTSIAENLENEVRRLQWAHAFALVPEVLERGSDESGSWMVTAALPGESAVSERWKVDPETAVRVAGSALRRLHEPEALPVAGCPFDWSIETRRQGVRPSKAGDPRLTDTAPTIDRLVVCHGDECVPNTLIAPNGTFVGHVILAILEWRTAGPTLRSPHGARTGTMGRVGTTSIWSPTASNPIPIESSSSETLGT